MSHWLITHFATEAYVAILNRVTRSRWFQALADLTPTRIGWEAGWVPEPIRLTLEVTFLEIAFFPRVRNSLTVEYPANYQ